MFGQSSTSRGFSGVCVWAAIFFLSMCAAELSQAQVSSESSGAVERQVLDQVIVRGGPKALAALREEMIRLEDNFFDRYNELNTIKDFDVHCAAETSAGTKLKRRRCRANYMSDALAVEGQGHAEFIKKHPPALRPALPGRPPEEPVLIDRLPLPSIVDIEIRRTEYQQNLVKVSESNPELAQMLREFSELNKRYQAIQRSRR
jgi:hypothetical protein